jgi:hypothetical protein
MLAATILPKATVSIGVYGSIRTSWLNNIELNEYAQELRPFEHHTQGVVHGVSASEQLREITIGTLEHNDCMWDFRDTVMATAHDLGHPSFRWRIFRFARDAHRPAALSLELLSSTTNMAGAPVDDTKPVPTIPDTIDNAQSSSGSTVHSWGTRPTLTLLARFQSTIRKLHSLNLTNAWEKD